MYAHLFVCVCMCVHALLRVLCISNLFVVSLLTTLIFTLKVKRIIQPCPVAQTLKKNKNKKQPQTNKKHPPFQRKSMHAHAYMETSLPLCSSSSSRDNMNTWPLSLRQSPHSIGIYTYFNGLQCMHNNDFPYQSYLSKFLNLTLYFESLSSRFLKRLILLANFSAAGKLFQLVITLLLNADFPILE